jgi:hypothetical protein
MLRRTGVPVEASETVSGAIPETPEERAARVKRQEGVMADFAASAEEQKAVAAERTALAKESQTNALNAAIKADIDQRDAQAQLMAAKNAADSKWAEIQNENQAAAAQRVDPNRLFHGKNGAAVAIGSALMAGLGAYGSTLARGPNYAQQIIQSAIDRDIASQTDAIQRQGIAARNAVSDFARTYGLTLDEAKLGVKSAQLRYAASMAELNGSKIGTLDAKQRAAALNMELTKQSEALAMDMRNMYEGRVQKHFQVIRPQRGTRGGMVEVSREETTKSGQSPDERRENLNEQKFVTEYGEKRRDVLGSEEAMKQYGETMGVTINPDGTVTPPEGDIPGTGATSHVPGALLTDKGRNVRQTRQAMIAAVQKQATGMGATESEREGIKQRIEGWWDVDATKGLEYAAQVSRDYARKLDASYGPHVVKQYQQQESETQRNSTSKERAAPKLERY